MEKRGLKEIGHSGGLPGWMSYLTRYPKQNLTITILANASPTNPNLVLSALADRIAEIYLWQQMKPMESFATDKTVDISDGFGQYDYAGGIMTITRERDQLFAQLTGQPKFEIPPNPKQSSSGKLSTPKSLSSVTKKVRLPILSTIKVDKPSKLPD